uniref:Progestin and adipoQ receptor family member 3 n=1 Tax=Panagrellus redivivus TaxID=6233 RepID=A0A7E4W7D9_PANRE
MSVAFVLRMPLGQVRCDIPRNMGAILFKFSNAPHEAACRASFLAWPTAQTRLSAPIRDSGATIGQPRREGMMLRRSDESDATTMPTSACSTASNFSIAPTTAGDFPLTSVQSSKRSPTVLTAKSLQTASEPRELMLVEHTDVPQLLRRTHIRSGYRPLNQSVRYYLASAFKLHNEVVNFWTHLLPLAFIYARYIHPELFFEPQPRWQLLILYSGISILFVASSMTHLLHSRSQLDHVFWLLIDFSGILTFSLCVGIQRLSMRENSSAVFNYLYLSSLVFVSYLQYWSTSFLFVLKHSWKPRHLIRLITCLACGIWPYIPLASRYFYQSTETVDVGLTYHSNALFWLLLSGIFMGANIPECFAPGVFDYFCYGHQLFHLCVFMVTWNLCEAAHYDASLVDLSKSDGLYGVAMNTLLGNVLAVGATIWLLVECAKSKIDEKKHL